MVGQCEQPASRWWVGASTWPTTHRATPRTVVTRSGPSPRRRG